jgi:serpin B
MAAADAARDGQTALALRLTKHLAPADAAGKNVAFSPVSVHAGLALVAAGAGGATQAQLLSFLGAPTADGLAAFGRRVSNRVLADRAEYGGPRVLFGGGVWIDESRGGLKKAFQNIAAKSYKSEARTVNFVEEVSRLLVPLMKSQLIYGIFVLSYLINLTKFLCFGNLTLPLEV